MISGDSKRGGDGADGASSAVEATWTSAVHPDVSAAGLLLGRPSDDQLVAEILPASLVVSQRPAQRSTGRCCCPPGGRTHGEEARSGSPGPAPT